MRLTFSAPSSAWLAAACVCALPSVAFRAEAAAAPRPNTWTRVANSPGSPLSNPILMMDGSVIFHANCSSTWYKLTPDPTGSYIKGAWSQIAPMPSAYQPSQFASQVLYDGRIIISGGEYQGKQCQTRGGAQGAIYDPVANTWVNLAPPSGWTQIRNGASVILSNGQYMLAEGGSSSRQAILDLDKPTWTMTGTGKADLNYSERWSLLPNNMVLTVDTYFNSPQGCGRNSELYRLGTTSWSSAGNTATQLSDCPNFGQGRTGPLVVRPTGMVVGFTGLTGSDTEVPAISFYNPFARTWSVGPDMPVVGGARQNANSAPAVALPSGGILFVAGTGETEGQPHFFELTRGNSIIQRPDTPNSPNDIKNDINLLMLPTGQVLQTDGIFIASKSDVEIYTPTGTYLPQWAPVITSVPSSLTRGATYTLVGTQLNGVSGGASGAYHQAATNFPLVRLTNTSTGAVVYARTSKVFTRSIAQNQSVTARFVMPRASAMTAGTYKLEAVANGIPSEAMTVTVN